MILRGFGVLSLQALDCQFELLKFIFVHLNFITAEASLPRGSPFDLRALRFILRNECLNDVQTSRLFHRLVINYKVETSSERSREEGNILGSGCSNDAGLCGIFVVSFSERHRVILQISELLAEIEVIHSIDIREEHHDRASSDKLSFDGFADLFVQLLLLRHKSAKLFSVVLAVDRGNVVKVGYLVPVLQDTFLALRKNTKGACHSHNEVEIARELSVRHLTANDTDFSEVLGTHFDGALLCLVVVSEDSFPSVTCLEGNSFLKDVADLALVQDIIVFVVLHTVDHIDGIVFKDCFEIGIDSNAGCEFLAVD